MAPSPNFKDIIASEPDVFILGVAGDSGSGKTTFTSAIRQIFGPDLVSTISLDDYHRYGREERKRLGITPLHPDANDLPRLESDVATLKAGCRIEKPVYNHRTGRPDPPVQFCPGKILILEGLHTFFTPRLRELVDFSIFVDPAEDVKRDWKTRRDTEKRGYKGNEVEEEFLPRKRDYDEYVRPQREYAEAIIEIRFSKYGKELGLSRNVYGISLMQDRMRKHLQDAELNIDLFSLLSLHNRDFLVEFSVSANPRFMGTLHFDGELNYPVIRKLEQCIEQQTRVFPISIFENRTTVTATEIIQLILSWRIIHRRIFLSGTRPERV